VGNHTQGGVEAMLVPYLVRREIGIRVRPLTDRGIGRMRGPAARLARRRRCGCWGSGDGAELCATTSPFWCSPAVAVRSEVQG